MTGLDPKKDIPAEHQDKMKSFEQDLTAKLTEQLQGGKKNVGVVLSEAIKTVAQMKTSDTDSAPKYKPAADFKAEDMAGKLKSGMVGAAQAKIDGLNTEIDTLTKKISGDKKALEKITDKTQRETKGRETEKSETELEGKKKELKSEKQNLKGLKKSKTNDAVGKGYKINDLVS